jgi:hypothetical protein
MRPVMITEQQHADACRGWQKFFDDHLQDIGAAARPYIPGQRALDYAREECRTYKRSYLEPDDPLYVAWR